MVRTMLPHNCRVLFSVPSLLCTLSLFCLADYLSFRYSFLSSSVHFMKRNISAFGTLKRIYTQKIRHVVTYNIIQSSLQVFWKGREKRHFLLSEKGLTFPARYARLITLTENEISLRTISKKEKNTGDAFHSINNNVLVFHIIMYAFAKKSTHYHYLKFVRGVNCYTTYLNSLATVVLQTILQQNNSCHVACKMLHFHSTCTRSLTQIAQRKKKKHENLHFLQHPFIHILMIWKNYCRAIFHFFGKLQPFMNKHKEE